MPTESVPDPPTFLPQHSRTHNRFFTAQICDSNLTGRIIERNMPSLPDSIVIFVLALLLFGPKKLPVLARELGKWIGEFRRASNEFKMQMEEELRLSEQAEREQKIAAMEAAAPPAPLPGVPAEEPEHPHLPPPESSSAEPPATPEPLPIASSGDLNLMPPSTGLPTPRAAAAPEAAADISPLLDSIPAVTEPPPPPDRHRPLHETPEAQETPVHG